MAPTFRLVRGAWWSMCAAIALALVPVEAGANDSLHAVGTFSAGVTDNVSGRDDEDGGGRTDGFATISPGVIFSQESPRMAHVAQYVFSARMYLTGSSGNSINNRLQWQSVMSTSPQGELGFGLGFTHGDTNAFDLAAPASGTGVANIPEGGITYVSANADQSYSRDIGRDWRLGENAGVQVYRPFGDTLDVTASHQITGALDVGHTFQYDAITARMRGRYVSISEAALRDGNDPRKNRQYIGGPELQWTHDLAERWSTNLGAGFVGVANAETPDRIVFQPTGSAALNYALDEGSAALRYRYDVLPNLRVAETSAVHRAEARGGIPVPRLDRVRVQGAVGYQYGRILDTRQAEFAGDTNLFVIDGEVSWEFRPGFVAAGRLQTFKQTRDEDELSSVRDVSRSQVILSLTVRYPPDQATVIPERSGGRVDRRFEDPVGGGESGDVRR